jgi:cytoskeletal protein CcmA (bactofilin family)
MSQPYKSGRQQNLNLGISSITENSTVLQTIGKVGIGTTNAQNHSLFVVGSTNITGDINVGGVSTFVGVGTFGNDLYVANQLYVSGGATIGQDITTRHLLATGVSTFVGVSTFGNDVYINADLYVKDDLTVDEINARNINVTGVSTLGISSATSLYVSGVSTFVGVGTFNNDLYVGGDLYVTDDLTVDEINSRNINVTGVSTLGISSATTLYVSGVSTFVGIGTFGSDLYVGGDLYVKDDLTVQDQITTDNIIATGLITATSLSVSTNFDVFDSTATFHNDLFVAGNLSIGGTTTVLIAEDLFIIDKTIVLGITTDSLNVDIANDDTANGGGISIASTEGNPLVSLQAVGVNSLPNTHKKFLWARAGTYGVGTTDAWLFNYAVGIGSTQVPNGTRLAVGGVHITDTTVEALNGNFTNAYGTSLTYNTADVDNAFITAGIVTTIAGSNLTYTTADVDNAFITAGIVTTIAGSNLTYTTADIDTAYITAGIVTTIAGSNLTYTTADIDTAYITTGIVTTLSGSNVFYTNGNFGTADIDTAYVTTGIVTTIAGSNLTYTTADIDNAYVTAGIVTTLAGSNLTYTTADIDTAFITAGIVTTIAGSNLTYATADVDTAYITSGIVTTIQSTDATTTNLFATSGIVTTIAGSNLTYTTGNLTTGNIVTGVVTTLTSTNATLTNINSAGITTLGIVTANSLFVSGVTTSTNLTVTSTASIQNLTVPGSLFANLTGNVNSTGSNTFGQINVTGLSTFAGITTVTGTTLFTKQLNISGVATFGSNAYFGDSDVLNFGDGNDLQIYHDGTNSVVRDIGVGSLILGSDGVGVDIYNITQGEYQARFGNNGAVELYYDSIKRLETTGYGVSVYDTLQTKQLNVSGVSTFGGPIAGFVTFTNNVSVAGSLDVNGNINFNGDLFQDNQPFIASRWTATTTGGDIYRLSNVGIGTSTLTATLTVSGDANISGVITARQFVGDVNAGIATLGVTTAQTLDVYGKTRLRTRIHDSGDNPGTTNFVLTSGGPSGNWSWQPVTSVGAGTLNGIIVQDEGGTVGTAGSITTLDFRGNNIVVIADPQPNAIATITVSDTPSFLNLTVTPGISTLGVTTTTNLTAQSINVSGLSTFTGIVTTGSDLYVGGDLYVNDDIVFDSFTAREITVNERSNLGIASATTLNVTGITTTALLNVGVGGTIITTTNTTRVGINSISPNFTLDVNGDINFNGTLYQNNSPFIASRWSAGLGDDIYRLNGDVGIGTTNPAYKFEVVGDARISGLTSITNLQLSGTIGIGTTTGNSGQYLRSTGVGVTWADFPTLRTTGITTATEGQTTFSFSYSVGFIDVYVNGVKLIPSEFIASNGSSVVLNSPAYQNDIVELIGYNTVSTSGSGGGGGATSLNDLTDVTLTSPAAGETLVYDGSQWVNDYNVTASTSTTSQTVIHTLSSSTYRSVEYTIQATQGLKYHLTKVLVVHDGLLAYPTEYGTVYTIDSLGTFDVDVFGGNIRLLVTPAAATTTNYKVKFTAFKV